MLGDTLAHSEIHPGLALLLNPRELKEREANCDSGIGVEGNHVFVCLLVNGGWGKWLPVFSRLGKGRKPLSGHRVGHRTWVQARLYYHEGQIWTAPHEAIIAATRAAGDKSSRGARNILLTLPSIKFDLNAEDGDRRTMGGGG